MSKFFIAACLVCAAVASAAELVNINTADSAALQTLNGIGPSKAQAIIDYRAQNGPFQSIEDIQNVSGIGPSTYANIKDHITVGGTQVQTQAQTTQQEQTQTTQAAASGGGALPPAISAAIVGSTRAYAGAGSVFDARAYDAGGNPLTAGVRYRWNFGDGATAEGGHVAHTYSYPGAYTLVLDAAYDFSSVGARAQVAVVQAATALVAEGDGSLTVYNKAASDMDIGRWALADGGRTFVVPEDTIVSAGGGVRFAAAVTGLAGSRAAVLLYPNGTEAAAASVGQGSPLRGEKIAVQKLSAKGYADLPADTSVEVGSPSLAKPPSADTSASRDVAAAATGRAGVPPWAVFGALALVLGIGAWGAWAAQQRTAAAPATRSLADEFEIE